MEYTVDWWTRTAHVPALMAVWLQWPTVRSASKWAALDLTWLNVRSPNTLPPYCTVMGRSCYVTRVDRAVLVYSIKHTVTRD